MPAKSKAEAADAKIEERAVFDDYPARPYHEAVDPAAFPDGLPPEALPPSEEPTDG